MVIRAAPENGVARQQQRILGLVQALNEALHTLSFCPGCAGLDVRGRRIFRKIDRLIPAWEDSSE
jgi:hypothetical protein